MSDNLPEQTVSFYKPGDFPAGGVGPGSQPDDAEEQLDFPVLPREIQVYAAPAVPEADELDGREAAIALLESVLAALRERRPLSANQRFDLSALGDADRALVDQVLGCGEVSLSIARGGTELLAQESVLAGIWQLREQRADGTVIDDVIEVGAIPSAVLNRSFAAAEPALEPSRAAPAEVLNGPSVLVELAEHIADWRPGQAARTVNLSLLPLAPPDIAWISEVLGSGPTTILSRGYGNCRIGATRYANTWWIKYFNSQDHVILETLDVCEVPPVACAAEEDLADAAERLDEILVIYR